MLLIAAGTTLALQLATAAAFVGLVWWLGPSVALFVIGAAVLLVITGSGQRSAALAGFGCVMAALLVTPAIWSALTVVNSSSNQ